MPRNFSHILLTAKLLWMATVATTATALVATAELEGISTKKPVVVARYPHNNQDFVQGLEYLGNGLYLQSTGLVGASSLQIVRLKTAEVLQQKSLPISKAFGEGATVLNDTVYQLTWKQGTALSFDRQTLQAQGQHPYHGEGWGLSNNGKQLIMSNGSAKLVWRQPRTFTPIKKLTVKVGKQPIKRLNELEYVSGIIFANIWLTDRIACIDAKTGQVLLWLDIAELSKEASLLARQKKQPFTFDDVANGIAYVPERGTLLLTGKRWPVMFEVKLPPPDATWSASNWPKDSWAAFNWPAVNTPSPQKPQQPQQPEAPQLPKPL